ncbi:hypothetical protein B0I18_11526 [Taibaiella chishuiensis]|uniref:Uncharacterized protein n=1 Tax=Taibaiella chishuiensis TaxID=1434707 RepID=A0A2P8CT53_9BACT|nr:hypothetical protein B0I18_11526 [Taibaiella chishuiensis]
MVLSAPGLLHVGSLYRYLRSNFIRGRFIANIDPGTISPSGSSGYIQPG